MNRKVWGVGLAVAAAFVVGCASHTKTAGSGEPPVNTVCPVGGHDIEADAPRVAYKGTTIGFCCDNCVKKFDKMTDAEKDQVLAKATAK